MSYQDHECTKTQPLMVIDPCAKYGMQMSKQTEVTAQHC